MRRLLVTPRLWLTIVSVGLVVLTMACHTPSWPPPLEDGIVRVTSDDAEEVASNRVDGRRIGDTSLRPIRMVTTPWDTTVLTTTHRAALEVDESGRIRDRDPEGAIGEWRTHDPLLAVTDDALLVVENGHRLFVVTATGDAELVVDDLAGLTGGDVTPQSVMHLATTDDHRVVLAHRTDDDSQLIVNSYDPATGDADVVRGPGGIEDRPWDVPSSAYFASAVVDGELWIADGDTLGDGTSTLRVFALDLSDGTDRVVAEDVPGGPFVTSMTRWDDGAAFGLSSSPDGHVVIHVGADGAHRVLVERDDFDVPSSEGVITVDAEGRGWLSVQQSHDDEPDGSTGRYQHLIDLSVLDPGSDAAG